MVHHGSMMTLSPSRLYATEKADSKSVMGKRYVIKV